jgi:hypothetical protein
VPRAFVNQPRTAVFFAASQFDPLLKQIENVRAHSSGPSFPVAPIPRWSADISARPGH